MLQTIKIKLDISCLRCPKVFFQNSLSDQYFSYLKTAARESSIQLVLQLVLAVYQYSNFPASEFIFVDIFVVSATMQWVGVLILQGISILLSANSTFNNALTFLDIKTLKTFGRTSPFLHSLSAVLKNCAHLAVQVVFGYVVLDSILLSNRFLFIRDYLDNIYG